MKNRYANYSVSLALIAILATACGDDVDRLIDDELEDDLVMQEDMDDNDHGGDDAGTHDGPHDGSHNDSDDGDSHASHNHHCMMIPEFAQLDRMTRRAVQAGPWSNPETWDGGVPVDGDNVYIPEDIEVTVASNLEARLQTVRVDGSLSFDPNRNTRLLLDTLVTACGSSFNIGSASNPVDADVKAQIVFIDNGPVVDDQRLSRGAILIGQTRLYGNAKLHRAVLSPQAREADISLSLQATPSGWVVGDELVITGTQANDPRSDEIRYISQIDGQQVLLDRALDRDHIAPQERLNVYVANTTRNIEFVSENPAIAHRGHIMLMNADAEIHHVRFTELGRTDKTRPLDDFLFEFEDDSAGDDAPDTALVIPLGGSNVRGRYAIHFHQNGTDPSSSPAQVSGSVVFNGPGWGFVNHSSHVHFVDNVSYGLQGAGFYTEAGDEIGVMRGNIAIRSVNDSFELDDQGAIDPDLRADHMDYGHDGDGFWLTGNQVSLIDNVSAGASAHGIIFWTDGIMEPSSDLATRVSVSVARLPNGDLIADRESVPVWWAPLAEIRGNETYGATVGFRIRYVHAKNYLGRDETSDFHRSPPQAYINTLNPEVRDLTVWGSRDGVLLNYNERMRLINARIVGFGRDQSEFSFNPGTAKSGIGLDIGNDATHGPGRVDNVSIEGFGMGMATPVNGEWELSNLSLTGNGVDLLFQPEESETQVILRNSTWTSFDVVEDEERVIPGHIRVINEF